MEKFDLSAYLSGNEYPGRGICIGVTPDGKQALIGYFIMGRSANSRNRVFAPIEGGIETRAADPAKLEDPHLIIYNPVLTLGDEHIVTNGDQTNTIYDAIQQGGSFESGLRKTVEWYLAERAGWCRRVLDGSCRLERLGLGGGR